MAFKTFTSTTLTASEVNDYLMSQAIIRCTSGTRPSSPSEGWHIYETDTRRFLGYRGGQWVPYGRAQELYAFQPDTVNFRIGNDRLISSDLKIEVEAGKKYYFDSHLSMTVSGDTASAWVEIIMVIPSDATGTMFRNSSFDIATGLPTGLHETLSTWEEINFPGTDKRTWSYNVVPLAPDTFIAQRRCGILRTFSQAGTLEVWFKHLTNPDIDTLLMERGSFLRVKEIVEI